MKYPHLINSDYFELLLSAGWFIERDVTLKELPSHLEEMPKQIKNFLRELWFVSFSKKFYYIDDIEDYHFGTIVYNFGETTTKLEDYSIKNEYTNIYTNLVNCKLRNFGFKDCRELLIDECGRLYTIPDSGDLYVFKGRFYEALYNLIFNHDEAFLVGEHLELFNKVGGLLQKAELHLTDI